MRLFMVEIGGFGGRLLQREVPGEGACLHALVSVTAFSRCGFRLVYVWVFCFFFWFTVCLCNCSIVTGLFVGIVVRLAIFLFV